MLNSRRYRKEMMHMRERAAALTVFLLIFLIWQLLSSFLFKDEAKKESVDMSHVIWQDFMHVGPIPICWRFYQFVGHHLYIENIFSPLTVKEYAASKINSVKHNVSFIEHFWGTGTLILCISGKEQDVVLKGVRYPKKTKEMLEKWARMERNRIKKAIHKR